jgi:hypothetical protein
LCCRWRCRWRCAVIVRAVVRVVVVAALPLAPLPLLFPLLLSRARLPSLSLAPLFVCLCLVLTLSSVCGTSPQHL